MSEEWDALKEEWDALKDEILSSLKETLKNFAANEADTLKDFLEEIARDYAREKWLSLAAPEAERTEHLRNLEHLVAQTKGALLRRSIRLARETENAVLSAVESVGRFLIKIAPHLLTKV